MSIERAPRRLARRGLLIRFDGAGTTVAAAPQPAAARVAVARAQAEGTPAPEWTPPPIPQPLPTPGGTPPPLVGAAPAEPEAPVSSAPTSIENPLAAGTPGAAGTPVAGGEIAVTNPQQPAQPLATPVAATPVAPAPAATVTLTADFRFDPAEVTIRVGQAVEWRNAGRSPQTVTGDPARVRDKSLVALPAGAPPWDSGVLNYGDTFAQTFDVAGDYAYVSMPQEANGMTGRVVVQG